METIDSNASRSCRFTHPQSTSMHLTVSSNGQSSEDPTMSWEFYVNHYNETQQAYRDSKYTWRQPNGDFYVGTNPPNGSEPLGILYPRVGTLGGCANHNAMNAAIPPDNDWNHIANLTGDASWSADNMRKYYQRLEKAYYVPNGTEGHGFSGYLGVCSKTFSSKRKYMTDLNRSIATISTSSDLNQASSKSSNMRTKNSAARLQTAPTQSSTCSNAT
jgi:choline dehydrogenase-like flavoprotein